VAGAEEAGGPVVGYFVEGVGAEDMVFPFVFRDDS